MSLALSSDRAVSPRRVHELQEQIHTLQGRRNQEGSHPVLPCFSSLFPAGLKGGAAYSLNTPLSVAMALMAGASSEGQWCGVVGVPGFGAEAAAGFGVDLERLVLVPDPGPDWPAALGGLVDVLPLVLVKPPQAPRPSDASRLAARLRERAAVLLVLGPWPQSDGMLRVREARWEGLGQGHGRLESHRVRLELDQRGRARAATLDLGRTGGVALPGGARQRNGRGASLGGRP